MHLATKVVSKIMGSAFPIRRAVSRSSPENVEQVKRKDRGGTEAPLDDPTSRDQGHLKQKDFEDGLTFNFKVDLIDVTDPASKKVRKVPALTIRSELSLPTQQEYILNYLEQNGATPRKKLADEFVGFFGSENEKQKRKKTNKLIHCYDS